MQNLGYRARSWQGWQIPLETDEAHGKARIKAVDEGATLQQAIDDRRSRCGRRVSRDRAKRPGVATLGRGGSDTSAVALAAAVKADRCDIYTDVDGVYTTDPRITKHARRIDRISYEEMLEMASVGAKVLQTRSVELAMAQQVPLRVLSSFDAPDAQGPAR